MKTPEPKTLEKALVSVLEELGLGKKIRQLRALEVWNEAVGERIARVATPERIDGGKLVVRVSNAPWRSELVFLKKEIMVKLNKALGEEVVKEIHFR
jgi:predicted nucleic acid-binding Zn ribbon protein